MMNKRIYMQSLHIQSGQGAYSVDFFEEISDLVASVKTGQSTMLVIDRNVANLYEPLFSPLFRSMPTLHVEGTEDEKTLTGIRNVAGFLQDKDCNKQSVILSVGGGIIQDIVTFTAHIYYRVIKWIYVPTTLLSMSDSCIGAKCGINFQSFKNQLGVFHAPSRVLIAPRFIETLSDTDVQSGYGEILKLCLTGRDNLFDKLINCVDNSGFRNSQISELLYNSLKVKKDIIQIDEYETDLRRILNYGHTFGHALEAITQHEISHGLAVAWGIDLANFISLQRGLLSKIDYCVIHDFIAKHFSYHLSVPLSVRDLIQAARRDKKIAQGKLNLVLLEYPGSLKIVPTAFDQSLEASITEFLSSSHVIYWD